MPRISISVVAANHPHNGRILSYEVGSDLSIADLKGFVQAETAFEPSAQQLYFNNQALQDDQQTLDAAGVKDGDMLALTVNAPRPQQRASSSQQIGPPTDPQAIEQARQQLVSNPSAMAQTRQNQPALAEAAQEPERFREVWLQMVRDEHQRERNRIEELARINEDVGNIEAQKKIEEMIRQERVMENLQFAYEHSPEVFGRVHMLYVPVQVNRIPVKAFVDSGAQTTIMSPSCAENCGIMRLIDKRYSGIAKGVGTAAILGRVHAAYIQIGRKVMSCSFTVMEGKDVDLLLGLDMLRRFQACIDLRQNKLIFGEGNDFEEVKFLGEAEIPKYLDDAHQNEPTLKGPDGTEIGAKTGTVKAAGTSAAAAASSSSPPSAHPSGGSADNASQTETRTLGRSTVGLAPDTSSDVATSANPPASGHSREKIRSLIEMGFDEQQAINALDATNGNVEYAASFLFDT